MRPISRREFGGIVVLGALSLRAVSGADTGAAGDITGRALTAGARPGLPPVPLAGVSVVALPRDEPLIAQLEEIKRHARDSMASYRSAIARIRAAVEAHIRILGDHGASDRVRAVTTEESGRFAVAGLPSGTWLLLAVATAYVDRVNADTVKDRGGFLPQERLVGYERVTVWLQEVSVAGGMTETVELTDRNGWFSGIEEKIAPRHRGPATGKSRRPGP